MVLLKQKRAAVGSHAVSESSSLQEGDLSSDRFLTKEVTAAMQKDKMGVRPVQFNFSQDAYLKLAELKERLGVTSKTEVVRLGLAVLSWVVEELEDDHKILVQREPGKAVELAFPYLKVKQRVRAI
jgi:hypothetical protein